MFGQWCDVVIDDKLPVDEHGRLIYGHNNEEKNVRALARKSIRKAVWELRRS